MGEIVSPSVLSPEEDKNPFYLGKQCPYVGASALQPAQAQLCASRQSPHRAPGPQPVAPSPSGRPMLAPKADWGKAGRSTIPGATAGHMATPAQQAGRRLPPSFMGLVTAATRQGRTGDTNNSHTKEKGRGSGARWSWQPCRGPGQGGVNTSVARLDA